MTIKKLIVIGESHTRQFAFRNNIIPLFSGNGKNINLDNPEIIQEKIDKCLKNNNFQFEKITFLYVGEPNCRIKLCNHWTPHWDELLHGKKVSPKIDKDYLKNCVEKYSHIDLSKIDYILTPTAAYDPIIPSLIYFNNLLKDKFGNKVIDIFSDTYDDNQRVKKEYKAKDWLKDPIHLNSRVSDLLLSELKKKKLINSIDDYSLQTQKHFGTHLIFEKNKTKFGTYFID